MNGNNKIKKTDGKEYLINETDSDGWQIDGTGSIRIFLSAFFLSQFEREKKEYPKRIKV